MRRWKFDMGLVLYVHIILWIVAATQAVWGSGAGCCIVMTWSLLLILGDAKLEIIKRG